MRQGPSEGPPMRKMKYEKAFALAKADEAEWIKIQILVLENHLVKMAMKKLTLKEREEFRGKLKELEENAKDTLENLVVLGREYKIFTGYNLEKESLRVFYRRNNIELVP